MDDMSTIIGSGMIAKSFSHYTFLKKCAVIAAGVSNSGETNIVEFQREEALIRYVLDQYATFKIVYFSTCSISQRNKTPYINHKLKVEKMIEDNARSYLIFRLPQAVGVTQNTTLIAFLAREILKNNDLTIQLKAKRNLIDVNDVARMAHQIIEADVITNRIVNIAARSSIFVSDIVKEISTILNCAYRSTNADVGEYYEISIEFLENFLHRDDPIFDDHYWKNVLLKYVPLIAQLTEE